VIRFIFNQTECTVGNIDPNTTLLDYLRGHLHRCGTKEGCGAGNCGACTVVVGQAVGDKIQYQAINACTTLVGSLHGKQLITVEDLQCDDGLHPVQQALVDCHGSQCGFCTPGVVMSLFAYRKTHLKPESSSVVAALDGNLCRCTGYRPIIDAALRVFATPDQDQFTATEADTVKKLNAINRDGSPAELEANGKRYFAPTSLQSLSNLLLEYPQARLVAGGTNLCLEITQSLRGIEYLLSVERVKELGTIEDSGDFLDLGAAVTYSMARNELVALYPHVRQLLDRLGTQQVRNMGTLAGNIANASAAADMSTVLIAMNARLRLRRGGENRVVRVEDFFVGSKTTVLEPSEFIERILVPKPAPHNLFRVYKVSKRRGGDIASVCGAFNLCLDRKLIISACVAFAGMAQVPKRARHCEQALIGQVLCKPTIERAMKDLAVDFTPVTDFRATARYRLEVSQNLLRRLLVEFEAASDPVTTRSGLTTLPECGMHRTSPDTFAGSATGSSPGHDSARKHVSGTALYLDDYPTPAGMLHAYVALSTVAHGKVRDLELSRVRNAEGVVDVLTLDDIPGVKDIGPVYPGDPIMVNQGDEVEFCGQVLFAVAATSHNLARKAARLAAVSYEPLPAEITLEEGLAHDRLMAPAHTQKRGDVDRAIAGSENRLRGELRIGGQEHVYLEGQAALCVPAEDGGMLVYSSTQSPSDVQKLVAAALNIPMNKVTVDVRRLGGAFGGKETQASQWACIAALLARKTGQAVKIRLSRSDDMLATGKRHSFLSRYEVGFDSAGRINGLSMQLAAGCGNSADLSDAVIHRAMFHADNAYFLPAAKIVGLQVRTNTVSSTAFRGFGAPQAMLSIESIVDDIARVVGKDPLEVRMLNLYGAERGRDVTHYGQNIEQHVLHALLERLERTSDYQRRRREIAEFNASSPVLKKGLSLTPVKFGIAFAQQHLNQAGALLHVHYDGSIEINHGGTEMGQGLFTKVAQVIAAEFNVNLERVHCTSTRTDKVPNTSPTAASTGSDLNGMAARKAALKIKRRMIRFASRYFGVRESEVCFADDHVIAGDRKLGFQEFSRLAYMNRISLSATGYYRTPKVHYDRDTAKGRPFLYYANGAAAAEVLIDTLTGEYKVLRVDICQDVGRSLNPALDTGQIEGGFLQGMGWLTTEELVWDKTGRLETKDLGAYKIPSVGDLPPAFHVELLPDNPNSEATIYHSKAVGEPPLMLAISVWNALRDAVSSVAGYRFNPRLDAPATPERVFMACEEMRCKVSP